MRYVITIKMLMETKRLRSIEFPNRVECVAAAERDIQAIRRENERRHIMASYEYKIIGE